MHSGMRPGASSHPEERQRRLLGFGLLLFIALLGGSLMWMIRMPGKSYEGPLPELSETGKGISTRLREHTYLLAAEIGQRNIWTQKTMAAATDHIEKTFARAGYQVGKQEYTTYNQTVCNLEAELRGHSLPGEIIVVGAHYDTVLDSPGADDNGSGVAVLLELARLLREKKSRRTIRFVAFANEEPPFYFSNDMGSRRYAARARERGETVTAMLSLETMGYYAEQPATQRYPFPFSLFYPDRANFIAFVGNTSSRDLVRRSIATFRREAQLPSEGLAAPGLITGIGWSDHWSFWQEGYPAIMITDTAFFRYAHYHTGDDTPEKLDYQRMALLVQGLVPVVLDLGDSE